MPFNHPAYIGIGSNLGDRLKNCESALDKISRIERTDLNRVSPFYESAAAGCKDGSGFFLNCAAKVSTGLLPRELLGALLEIECELGRPKKREKTLPRTIDLDILFYDDLVLNSPDLIIPHPELTKRLFVLIPLCDIEPALRHPVLGENVSELEKKCRASHPVTINKWKGC